MKTFFTAEETEESEGPEEEENEFDIDGTTADGSSIRVKSESDTAAVGDQVVAVDEEGNDGDPVGAGEHVITEGDLSGKTITTDSSGIITEIADTVEDQEEEEEEMSAQEQELAKELAKKEQEINTLKSQVLKLTKGRRAIVKKDKDTTTDLGKGKRKSSISTGTEEFADKLAKQLEENPQFQKFQRK